MLKHEFEIKIHFQEGLNTAAGFDFLKNPNDTIDTFNVVRDLYRTASIELQFTIGEINIRLTNENDAKNLLYKFKKNTNSGNLMLCNKNFLDNSRGFLYSPQKERGLVFIFLEQIKDSDKANGILQTCAHEIGHLLNFDHIVDNISSDNDYISTMHVYNIRSNENTMSNWNVATAIAEKYNYYDGAFHNPRNDIKNQLFPFPHHRFYNTLSHIQDENNIKPWGSEYHYKFDNE